MVSNHTFSRDFRLLWYWLIGNFWFDYSVFENFGCWIHAGRRECYLLLIRGKRRSTVALDAQQLLLHLLALCTATSSPKTFCIAGTLFEGLLKWIVIVSFKNSNPKRKPFIPARNHRKQKNLSRLTWAYAWKTEYLPWSSASKPGSESYSI